MRVRPPAFGVSKPRQFPLATAAFKDRQDVLQGRAAGGDDRQPRCSGASWRAPINCSGSRGRRRAVEALSTADKMPCRRSKRNRRLLL